MRTRLTACTDKAFFYATMPLVRIQLSAPCALNDNEVVPPPQQTTHSRHPMRGLLPAHLARRAASILRSASQRGLFQATRQNAAPR